MSLNCVVFLCILECVSKFVYHVYMYNVSVQVNKGPDCTIMRDFYTCVYASSSHNTEVTCVAGII